MNEVEKQIRRTPARCRGGVTAWRATMLLILRLFSQLRGIVTALREFLTMRLEQLQCVSGSINRSFTHAQNCVI